MTTPSKNPLFDALAFGNQVQQAIDARDLTYRTAAAQMGISTASAFRLACGLGPSVETYLRAQQWLGAAHGSV